MAEEAAVEGGQVSELTRQRVELAITAAARKDDGFGGTVNGLVARLRAAERAAGLSVVAGAGSTVFTGDAHAQADSGGFAVGQVGGDIHLGRDGEGRRPDPPVPGRSSH